MPAQIVARLPRGGHLKIACLGVYAGDTCASTDEIATVADSTVQLSSDRKALIKEPSIAR